jgi:hypothetical protein
VRDIAAQNASNRIGIRAFQLRKYPSGRDQGVILAVAPIGHDDWPEAAIRRGSPARPLQKGACAHNDLALGVRGQSKQWLTDSFSHRKSVVLQVNSKPYRQSDAVFLIRDSAQFGARRLSGEAAGFGNPTPVLRGKQLATGSPNRHNGGGKSLEAVHPLSANGGYRPNSAGSGRAMSSGPIAPERP